MMKITKGNSVCKIEGFDRAQFGQLRGLLSFRDKTKLIKRLIVDKDTGRKAIRRVYPIKFLIDKYGVYPTGLDYLVMAFLKKKSIQVSIQDNRKPPKLKQLGMETLFQNQLRSPYPEQLEAAEACHKFTRGIVAAPTGTGKSFVAELIIDRLQVKTLVVVPGVGLKTQLTESLREAFGSHLVGPMVNGKCISFITVENIDQLALNKIKPDVDCIIIDEFHHSGADTYRRLNKDLWDDVYYKFGLTATPFRSNEDERLLLESVLSKVIYRIDYRTAVEKGYIVPMEAYYFELPKVKVKGFMFDEVYKELVVNREDRNQLLVDITQNLVNQGISTLVLCKQIKHGETLQAALMIPFAEGKNEQNEELIAQFNSKAVPGLIGTVGVIGEGVDTRPAEFVILAGGGKSKNQFMQNVGRGFRRFEGKTSCKVILFKDPSHKWMLKHFNECLKYLREEYGIEPTKLEL